MDFGDDDLMCLFTCSLKMRMESSWCHLMRTMNSVFACFLSARSTNSLIWTKTLNCLITVLQAMFLRQTHLVVQEVVGNFQLTMSLLHMFCIGNQFSIPNSLGFPPISQTACLSWFSKYYLYLGFPSFSQTTCLSWFSQYYLYYILVFRCFWGF